MTQYSRAVKSIEKAFISHVPKVNKGEPMWDDMNDACSSSRKIAYVTPAYLEDIKHMRKVVNTEEFHDIARKYKLVYVYDPKYYDNLRFGVTDPSERYAAKKAFNKLYYKINNKYFI
jgi:hypothetical protein